MYMTEVLPESIERMIPARSTVELLVTMITRKHEMHDFITMVQAANMPSHDLSKDREHLQQLERVITILDMTLRSSLELDTKANVLTAAMRVREEWDQLVSQYDETVQRLAVEQMTNSMERIAKIVIP